MIVEARVKKSAEQLLRKSVQEEEQKDKFDIFLSHSIKDARIVFGTVSILEKYGLSVYVDWIADPKLDRSKVNVKTAKTLKLRMKQSRSLVYLHSVNSSTSRWMPWELGYYDGFKGQCAILPLTKTKMNEYRGEEFLGLYPYISFEEPKSSNEPIPWVNESSDVYVSLRNFLEGSRPRKRV